MSSGQGRVDVEVESKRPDEPAQGKAHPNTCPGCGSHYRDDELAQTLRVCPQCGHHFRVGARDRIDQLVDPGSFVEADAELRSADPLDFFDLRPYAERLVEAEIETGLGDAIVCGAAEIEGQQCDLAVMDFDFMGGSMGSVVGEKFVRSCERATENAVPLVSVAASGGARMQEGILALMQLPKTICAIDELHESGGAMLSVLTHPTTGGVLASFASLGDVVLAEPGALMSFAGPRVVVADDPREAPGRLRPRRVQLPLRPPRRDRPARRAAGDAGPAPAPVRTHLMASEAEMRLRERLSKLGGMKLLRGTKLSGELARLQDQLDQLRADPTAEEIWQSVELARHPDRPYTLDYVERIFDDFFELHGDRGRADDPAFVTGLGKLDGRTVVLIGHQKGRDIKERANRNFGMAYPEGYRKAMRAMALAGRHGFPLVTMVDTPGAYPGVAAEQHGQGGAIARSQAAMVRLSVPTVACVIGEGGSGGAVAIAVADRVVMQENAIYSVISPEGCAAILWRDAGEARKAAAAFKPDAAHCLELGVVDAIVAEPLGGAHGDPDGAARLLEQSILAALEEIESLEPDERRRQRRAKYRVMGILAST